MYSKKAKKLISFILTIAISLNLLPASLFAKAIKSTEYAITNWGYDFTGSGLPNAYDPLTQSNTNNQFRYKWANEFYYFKTADGQYAYCLQLGVDHINSGEQDKVDLDKYYQTYFTENQRDYLKYTTIYGYKGKTHYGYNWQTELIATQTMAWIISAKYFDDTTTNLGTYENTVLNCIKAPSSTDKANLKACFRKMKEEVLSHSNLPKGTASNNDSLSLAKATYDLKYNKSNMKWETTVAMNSELSKFTAKSISGVSFSVDGNNLKVSATNAGLQNLKNSNGVITFNKTKGKYVSTIDKCSPLLLVTKTGNNPNQMKVSYYDRDDPVSAFIKLVSDTGTVVINKTFTANDIEIAGTASQYNSVLFQISHKDKDGNSVYLKADKNSDGVYTYTGYTTDVSSSAGFYRVGQNGKLTVKNLPAVSLKFSEIQTAEGFTLGKDLIFEVKSDTTSTTKYINAKQTGNLIINKKFVDTTGVAVEVTAEELAAVRFNLKVGTEYVKLSGSKGNYQFNGFSTSASVFELNAEGKINITGLPIETYTLKETKTDANYKLAGDITFKITQGRTLNVSVTNVQRGSLIDIRKTAQDYMGNEITDNELLEQIYAATTFRAYIELEDGTKQYITADLDNNTGSPYDSQRDFIYNYTGLTDNAAEAAILKLHAVSDDNLSLFFGTSRLKNVPDSIGIVKFEEITSYQGYGYLENIQTSEDRQDVNFTNRSYYFTAGFNKYISGTTTFLSDGLFGLYAAEDILINGELLYAKDEEIERLTANGSTTYFNTLLSVSGSYYIQEIKAPYGYIIDKNKYEVKADIPTELTNARLSDVILDIENTAITGELNIEKKDTFGNVLEGVVFHLVPIFDDNIGGYNGDGLIVLTTDNEGKASVKGLALGKYDLIEVTTIAPYYLPENSKEIVFTADELKINETFISKTEKIINEHQKVKLNVIKVASDNNIKLLSGAEFKVTAYEDYPAYNLIAGDEIGVMTTNEQGIANNDFTIYAGLKYLLTEVKAPAGYANKGYSEVITAEYAGSEIDYTDLSITVENTANNVAVSKQDVLGNELEGAAMQLIDINNNVVEEWVSDDKAHIINKLVTGTYTLHELYSPDGYVLATDIEITVSEDGTVTADNTEVTAMSDDGYPLIVMVDEATKVKISKRDITSDEELPGATLQVIKNDEVIEDWISTVEEHYIEAKLIAGETYILRETIAPKGYALTTDIEFTVNTDGTVNHVVMYNSDATGSLQVQKRTEGMINLGGIKFHLVGISDSGKDIDFIAITDDNGLATWSAIPTGTYEIIEDEKTVPTAYLTASPIEVQVFQAETTTQEIFNSEKTGTIEIKKTTVGMINLDGIDFVLSGTADNGRYIEILAKTDKDGKAVFKGIPIGTYTVIESSETTPYAYLTAAPQEVSVFYAQTTTQEISNDEKTGTIQLQKRTEGMTDISGIEFILSGESDSGRQIEIRATTDENGQATFNNIPIGTYTITENGETVPTGYLVADEQSVQVIYAQSTNVVVTNEKEPENAPTGASSGLSLIAITGLGAMALVSFRRKNTRI